MGLALFVAIAPLLAGPLRFISAPNPSVPLLPGGDGDSVAPQITPDGRFVLFTSSANDLTTNGDGLFVLNLFLRDRAGNSTALVSANLNGTGGDNNSMRGMVSTNGRYAVFQSDATDLVPGDTNGVTDVFVRDLVARTTTLVSVAEDGSFGNGASSSPAMTPDGRFVVFVSAATNLVIADTNGIPDVFVRDLATGSTTLVSIGATGTNTVMSSPVITPDGTHVAFFSTAHDLAPGVPAASTGEIYVRDLVAGTTTWASTNAADIVSNLFHMVFMPSYHPALSDDGNIVTFKAGWTNGAVIPSGSLIPLVSRSIIVRFNAATKTTTVVSTNAFPAWAYSDDVYGPEMTPDGRFIAYVATNGPPVNATSVQLWDSQTGSNFLVSAAMDGSLPTNSLSSTPVMSPDGRFVLFLSNATNLVSNAVSNGWHIYLRDLQAGITRLVDADTNGAGSGDEWGTIPSLSADGQLVAFCGPDGDFVPGNNNYDVFLRDTAGATTELISQRNPLAVPRSGNAASTLGPLSISADGRWVAFCSFASDLVTNDFNDNPDIFVTDSQTGSNILVSVGMNGTSGAGPSYAPVISANGRFVAFASTAMNLVAGQTNGARNIFVRDLQMGVTTLASVDSSGASLGTGDASAPVISSDGRYVAFLCNTNPAASPGTYWRDRDAGTTLALCSASAFGPSMSADGRRVAYFDTASNLYVWDAGLMATIYTNPASVAFAVLAPTGNRILWTTPSPVALNVTDLASGSNLLSVAAQYASPAPQQGAAPWSADGRFVTFVTSASLAPDDTNGTNDVYLCDLQTGMITLISANSSGTASASGVSDSPVIGADARFIAFRSFATDIAPGIATVPSLIVFDRTTGANTVLTTGSPGSWTSWVSRPAISRDGATVVFQSWDSEVLAGDLNRVQDVFAQSQTALVIDSDNDGIPDWWMNKYFGHPTGLASDLSRAQDDADGNGMSNLQEYLTGIDPTNPNAVFALQISPAAPSGSGVSLTWPAVAGKSYQIQYADDLSDPSWLDFSGSVVVIGGQGSIIIPAAQASRFYRVICVN